MEPIGPSHQVAELVVDAHEQDEQAIYSALSTPDNTNTSSSTSTKVPIPYTYHVPPQQSSSSKDRNFSLTQPSLIDLLSTQVPRADVSFLASYKAAVQQAEQKVASISFEPLMKSDGKNQQSNKEKRKTLLQEEDEDDAPPSQEAGPRSLDEELADWVGSKPARWLELLTKFGAASGLFFISGDALIIELLRESRLSWGFGAPQLLHFAFIVERFLKQLLDSGCQFRVIFFRDMRRALYNLKLRSVDNADVGAAALLARDIIASHLKNVESLDVNDTIDNWWTDEWKQYLKAEVPTFVLVSPLHTAQGAAVTLMRAFCLHLYAKRVPTAYLAEIEFSDNRIRAFCVEPYKRSREKRFAKIDLAKSLPLYLIDLPNASSSPTKQSVFEQLASADPLFPDFLRVLVLQFACVEHYLPLSDRAWVLPEHTAASELRHKVTSFFESLQLLLGSACMSQNGAQVDLFDWRLFSVLLHALLVRHETMASLFPDSVIDCARSYWTRLASSDASFEPILQTRDVSAFFGMKLFDFDQLASSGSLPMFQPPLPVRNPITDLLLENSVLPPVPSEKDYAEQQKIVQTETIFRDLHHWHSGRIIEALEESLSDEGAGTFGMSNNSLNKLMSFVEKYARSFETSEGPWRPIRNADSKREQVLKLAIQGELDVGSNSHKLAKRDREGAKRVFESGADAAKRRKLLEIPYETHTGRVCRDLYLVQLILQQCKDDKNNADLVKQLLVVIFDLVELYGETSLLHKSDKLALIDALRTVGLHDLAHALATRKFNLAAANSQPSVGTSRETSARFQLLHMGPWMERATASRMHELVAFAVDDWQYKVLDGIKFRKSLLVEAPTSAGKTFISFTAMKEVLNEDSDSVVVYVAPTKALVNQVAAEVYSHFKSYKEKSGVKLYGVFTRDYRQSPGKCRILVTVPACLEIMLMSPQLFPEWRNKLKYVIFDEVHSINNDEGAIWERLVAMAPCPFIALSATLGDTVSFKAWLKSISEQRANAPDQFLSIKHPYRYSDLQKHLLLVSKSAASCYTTELEYVHPWATFSTKEFAHGAPKDISFSSRDSFELFHALEKALVTLGGLDIIFQDKPVLKATFNDLTPEIFFKNQIIIDQKRCRDWAILLQDFFSSLTLPATSNPACVQLAQAALHHLAAPVRNLEESTSKLNKEKIDVYSRVFIRDALPATLFMLQERNMLPAIAFSFDRRFCEEMAVKIKDYFLEQEKKYKESAEYKAAVKKYEESQRQKEKMLKKKGLKRDAAFYQDISALEVTDPANLCGPRTTFTPHGEVMDRVTLQNDVDRLGDSVSSDLKEAIIRGVGVHHSGLSKKYLQLVERLFRCRQLKIVFATGTLALGINMPCKTTIFVDDSNYLTPIEYRQMSGRAGRRGFDPVGNVVFFSVPPHKIRKLEASELPMIRGHFPYTTSYLLRTLTLGAEAAKKHKVDSVASLYKKKPKKSVIPSLASSSTTADATPPDSWEDTPEDSTETVPPIVEIKPVEYEDEPLMQIPEGFKTTANVLASFFREPLFAHEKHADVMKHQVLNHIRFSLEFLIRSGLINLHAEPINLAGIAAHLHYAEPANFVACHILNSTTLLSLTNQAETNWVETSRTLIKVLSALFCRLKIPQNLLARFQALKDTGAFHPHKVVQDPLEPQFQELLDHHERMVVDVFVSSVIDLILSNHPGEDNKLPLSQITIAPSSASSASFLELLMNDVIGAPHLFEKCKIRCLARSAFVALSGHGDVFASTRELSDTVRAGVFLPANAIPSLQVRNLDGSIAPLNAYVLDMWNWKSGSNGKRLLEKLNHLREADAFDHLKDLMLIIQSIASSLHILMKAFKKTIDQNRSHATAAHLRRFDEISRASHAFDRLSDEFEEKLAIIFEYSIRRRYVIRVLVTQGFYKDVAKLGIERQLRDRVGVTAKVRVGPDAKDQTIVKITTSSEADWKKLIAEQAKWLLHDFGWKIIETRKDSKYQD